MAALSGGQVLGVDFLENGGGVLADVVGGDLEDLSGPVADEGHAGGAVGSQDELVDHAGHLPVNPVETGDQAVGPGFVEFFFRDVPGGFGGADDPAGSVTDRRDGGRNVDQGSVLASADGVKVPDRVPLADAGDDAGLLFQPVRRKEGGDGPPNHLGRGVAENKFRGVVPTRDQAIQ